ncbi:uncharacterized protein [Engystomops pustulosus]|uniref:uncharacterized protein isoform X2 n=1 Tax=Engystomops pustulosus TaxID=76066 RepID=UPI003AFA3133
MVLQLESYIRDSMHLIEQLQDIEIHSDTLLVTMDVESLYTNIAHDIGLKAVAYHLNKQVNSEHDIIFLWQGTTGECLDFIEELNTNTINVKLTPYISNTSVEFLDLKVLTNKEKITTSLFRKKTATNNILHYNSFHPQHLKKGIPYSQMLRLKRNCSDPQDFKTEARELTNRLRARGYPKKVISQAYMRVTKISRDTLLTPKPKISKKDNEVRLITTYNNQWQDLYQILGKNWNILKSEPRLRNLINTRPTITARRAKNLKDHLTRSHFIRPISNTTGGHRIKGTYACGECNICQYMANRDTFINPIDKKEYKPRDYINCKTRNVIYLLTCTCPKIYVGQTSQPLKKRIQQHFSSINMAKKHFKQDKNLTSVATHFMNFHGSQCKGVKIFGLEKIVTNIRGGDTTPILLQRESRWIYNLNSMTPTGLNEELLFSGFYRKT